MKRNKITTEKSNQIISLYENGENTIEDILKSENISSRLFYKILKDNNIKTNYRKRNHIRMPKHDLTGQKFGNLTVIKMEITTRSVGNVYRSICICDCGREFDANTNTLMRGLGKTCGNKNCNYHRQSYSNNGKNNIRFNGYEEITGQKWSSYKQGAIRRNLSFEIDIKDAWDIFIKQNRKCYFSGVDIQFGRTNKDYKNSTASMDRIDSKGGYTLDNVVWVHKIVNSIKWDLSVEDFLFFCDKIYNHSIK